MKNIHSQYPLTFSEEYYLEAQKVIDSLFEIPRTGWVDREVNNPETVGEHTEGAIALIEKVSNIPGLKKMLKIHDWAESSPKVGDARTDNLCPDDHRWSKEEKYQAELVSIKHICSTLGPEGQNILKLWFEFEEGKTTRAKIARQLDRTQTILKAIEYQKNNEPVIAQEFIDYYGPSITHPILKRMIKKALLSL